ncbi:hypothetical protein H9P43_006942 [Blastocladiella emersonii ATCC 22665]|nr:hypothetical protein H9P43_006942 [Blastocladiella emersonii ATCC 22665]
MDAAINYPDGYVYLMPLRPHDLKTIRGFAIAAAKRRAAFVTRLAYQRLGEQVTYLHEQGAHLITRQGQACLAAMIHEATIRANATVNRAMRTRNQQIREAWIEYRAAMEDYAERAADVAGYAYELEHLKDYLYD